MIINDSVRIFLSYSSFDKELCDTFKAYLNNYLKGIKYSENVVLWTDEAIPEGENFDEEIQNALAASSIGILLVSPTFLSSTYAIKKEFKLMKELQNKKDFFIIPILFRQINFEFYDEINKLQFLKTLNMDYGGEKNIDNKLISFDELIDKRNKILINKYFNHVSEVIVKKMKILKERQDNKQCEENSTNEDDDNQQQETIKEAMNKINQFISSYIPELKDISDNFHKKLFTQIRNENAFRINPKRAFVFGETNAGKTTTINSLLDTEIFDKNLFPASDKFNLTQTLNCGEHPGGLIIYDSPGIGDDEMSENVTRAALSIRQKEDDQVKRLVIIDATSKKSEGSERHRILTESEMAKYLDKNTYTKFKNKITGKEVEIADFQQWSNSKFDFFIFIISGGLSKGLNKKQIKFLQEFYKNIKPNQKVFKVINIVNDRKISRYKENFKQLDVDIQFALNNSIEEFRNYNLPDPEDWILVESNFNKGFDKVIESMVKSLSTDTLIRIEKSIKTEYSHLIQQKIDSFYFKYISYIASIVACYPVDYYMDGDTLLSYSIKSMLIVSEYVYQDSKNINAKILDNFIKEIRKARKDYKDTSYYATETVMEQKYKGTGYEVIDDIRTVFGYKNYENVPVQKRVLKSDEEKFYRIGGNFAIISTLAVGLSLFEVYRSNKQCSEPEFLNKITTHRKLIKENFKNIFISEKLRKNKNRYLRESTIKNIQPTIEEFVKGYNEIIK